MSYNNIEAGTTERFFTVITRAEGSPIVAGTVNYYLKAKSGANSGKWWRNSDQTWQVAETANAMTHEADGHWEIDLSSSPFSVNTRYFEYVKESNNLHIPNSRHLICRSEVAGSGADLCTLRIRETDLTPVADADVWITSDSTGDNVVAGTKQTNASGEVTFLLDAGETYYLWAQKDGWEGIEGTSFAAVAD